MMIPYSIIHNSKQILYPDDGLFALILDYDLYYAKHTNEVLLDQLNRYFIEDNFYPFTNYSAKEELTIGLF